MPDFSLEDRFNNLIVAGVDEAGRGPWAGPVVAGAAIIIKDKFPQSLLNVINDSKKLTKTLREKIYKALIKLNHHGCHVAIGLATVDEIDDMNILQATYLAMTRAVDGLPIKPQKILVDGNRSPRWEHNTLPVIKGDQISYSIATASIMAKVSRDKLMETIAREYPAYDWQINAGYGTTSHQKALLKYGITPHHRKTFQPIAKIIESESP